MDNAFTIYNVLILLKKKRKEIGIIILIAALFSTISSFLITPKYKSEAILYPTNIWPYSVESQTEQMVQLLQSNYIMEIIIKEFDFATRYKINPDKPGAKAALIKQYEENISVEKTEYESVHLKVLDIDPKVAAQIAKRIIDLMNIKIRAIHRDKIRELVIFNKNNVEVQKSRLDSLKIMRDTLRTKYHILDYIYQVKELYRGYLAGGTKSTEALNQIRTLEKMGEIWDEVDNDIKRVREMLRFFKNEYEKNLSDYQKEVTYANVVVEPYPNDQKAYPIRWLIVLSSTLSAFIFSIVIFLYIEFNPFKNLKN
jgi:uncharacterized protein involved in exopolysaccharide biosynthesis